MRHAHALGHGKGKESFAFPKVRTHKYPSVQSVMHVLMIGIAFNSIIDIKKAGPMSTLPNEKYFCGTLASVSIPLFSKAHLVVSKH